MSEVNNAIAQLEQQLKTLKTHQAQQLNQQQPISNQHVVTSKADKSIMCGASSGDVKSEWARHKEAVYKKYNVGGSTQEVSNDE